MCEICKRSGKDTRFGVCFDCATAESIVANGEDMWDNPVDPVEGYSPHMAKVKAILKLYNII